MICLENKTIKLLLSEEDGSVVSLVSKLTGWEIVGHNEQSRAFRLMLPLPEYFPANGNTYRSKRNNIADSKRSRLSHVQKGEQEAIFTWDQLTSEFGGVHNIGVEMRVRLTEEAAVFSMEIDNRSDVIVENAYFPYLCPLHPPGEAEPFQTFSRGYSTANQIDIFPTFTNTKGYFGVDTPIIFYGSNPQTPYTLLKTDTQGVCVMIGERSLDPLFYQLQLYPGWKDAISKRWADGAYADFAPAQLPYIAPGEKRSLIPILVQPYLGGWTDGIDVYKKYRGSYFSKSQPPAWLEQPHAWLQYHMNSPEDELRIRFSDLPQLAKSCAEAGIRVIQLVGWNDGGQDQGNPYHDYDRRLGTWEELCNAIAKCQDMGVRIVLFSKFSWADQGDIRYENTLKKMTVKDPFGNPYMHPGYQYQTLSQYSNVRVKRLMPLCFHSADTMSFCKQEFDKLIAAGADGTLYDECFHRGDTWLCFDPTHSHRLPAAAQGMDIDFAKQMLKGAPEDFLMAGEALYDSLFESYHLSYFRTDSDDHLPVDRYAVDDCRIMTAITGFDDRNMLNQCLMYNYIISYEPYNFKGRPEDFPQTIAYGKKVQALREELRDYLWDGAFLFENGAGVALTSGKAHHPYSVFQNRETGGRACVVCNYSHEEDVSVCVSFTDGRPARYRLVDGDGWHDYTDAVQLPPRSAAVVLEEV